MFSKKNFFNLVLQQMNNHSRSQMFIKIGVLKIFAIFTGKLPDLKAFNFIKKRLQHRCFPVNYAKSLTPVFLIEHLWWLLLKWTDSVDHPRDK